MKRVLIVPLSMALAAAAAATLPLEAQSFRAQVEPTVKAVRAQYPPQVLGDQIGEILNAIAWEHRPNIKLLKKGGGGNCPSPQGERISCDILIWAPPGTPPEQTLHIDVLSGASSDGLTPASPFWKSAGPCTKRPAGHPLGGSGCEMKNALEPVPPASPSPSPQPDPTPSPTPTVPPLNTVVVELGKLNDRLAALEITLRILSDRQSETHTEVTNAWSDVIRAIASLPTEPPPVTVTAPCMRGRVLGQNVTLCPVQ